MDIRELSVSVQQPHTSSSSLVDVQSVSLVLPGLGQAIYFFQNPLGTEADLIELTISGEVLVGSPVVRAWSSETADEYDGRVGIWVTCAGSTIQLLPGFGSRRELIGLPGAVEQYDEAQFFVVPTALLDLVDAECLLTATCMN